MTNEAPTPGEIDTMMSDIGSLVRVPFQVSRGLQTAKKLRAHIAALEAENRGLKNAAEKVHAWLSADYFSTHTYLEGTQVWDDRAVAICLLTDALAQTGEKS